jgi:hypothetical protein
MPGAGQALIVAAYKFAGVPDPERLAAAFLAQVKREPPRRAEPHRIRVVKEGPPPTGEPLRIFVKRESPRETKPVKLRVPA